MKLGLSPGGTPPAASISGTPTGTPTGKVTPTPKTATSSASLPDPPKPFLTVKDTPTGFLRVRMEPGTGPDATVSGQVNPGDKFTILDTTTVSDTPWYQIKYDGKNLGWVSGQYIAKTE
jgi:uncharacterized protein YgiM (DUF1202 family)